MESMPNSYDNENKSHLLKTQEKWIILSQNEIKHLFTYYVVLLIFSFLWVAFSILYHYEFTEKSFSSTIGIFMFAFPSGLLGATVYYIRKLYKSCIQNLVNGVAASDNSDAKFRKMGAKMYFYIRPIISGILSVLINIGFIVGFYLIDNAPEINNEKYFLFVILISFYVGFCNGKIIIKIEQQGDNVVNSIFKGDKSDEFGK